jgi:hypothetical protein
MRDSWFAAWWDLQSVDERMLNASAKAEPWPMGSSLPVLKLSKRSALLVLLIQSIHHFSQSFGGALLKHTHRNLCQIGFPSQGMLPALGDHLRAVDLDLIHSALLSS